MEHQLTQNLRRSERQTVRVIAYLGADAEGEQYGAGAYTIDLSPRGSRVHTPLDLAPGQVIEFQPEESDSITRCRVVWCGQAGSPHQAEAGLEFLESYPAPQEN
jgi:hypothetical protein